MLDEEASQVQRRWSNESVADSENDFSTKMSAMGDCVFP
jgi:hypothetical protein